MIVHTGELSDKVPLNKTDIVKVLRSEPNDEFQKIVKRGYWLKIKNRIKN